MHLPFARRVLPAAAFAMTGSMMACTGPNPAETVYVTVGAPPPAPYIEGEVVVRFPPGMTRADIDARVAPWGGVVLDGAFEGEAGASDTARTNLVDGLLRLGRGSHAHTGQTKTKGEPNQSYRTQSLGTHRSSPSGRRFRGRTSRGETRV